MPDALESNLDLSTFGDTFQDSGEGGLFVYAVWSYISASTVQDVDISMGVGSLQGAYGPLATKITRNNYTNEGGMDFDAVVLIGSTGSSLYNSAYGEYASFTRDNLSERGRTLVRLLEELYGGEATLVTYLDT